MEECAGTREETGTLTQGVALFSLVPLWESNPKLQGGYVCLLLQYLLLGPVRNPVL